MLLLIKQPGALQAIEELAALHTKKEEVAKTCLDYFRSVGEMESGEIDMVIDGVLQEGICFLGATPASGKTLVSLLLAKAICTGKPLFGIETYKVKKRRQVIYLIPESGDHAFIPSDVSELHTCERTGYRGTCKNCGSVTPTRTSPTGMRSS